MARNATFSSANLQYVSAPSTLNNLTDVTIASSTNKDLLQYSSSASKWQDVSALTLPQIQDTSSNHQYLFAVSELTANRTITLPLLTGNDTFVFNAHTATLTNKTLTSPVLNTGVSGSAVLDEDNMATNSATQLATQQSIKAYVDAQVATEDTLAELNDTTISGPASNDVLQYSGSAWVDRTYAEAGLVSLSGSETLTNKTLTSPTISGGALTALTDIDLTVGNKTIFDTVGANTLTIGASDTTVTIAGNLTVSGTTTSVATTNTNITDKLITLNDGGSASSGGAVGFEVEEDSSATGYIKTASDRAGWEIKAPSTAGVVTIDPSGNSNTIAFGGSSKTFTISETATINQDLSTTSNVTFANITANGNVVVGSDASDTVTINGVIAGASPLVFEGATGNAYETTLAIANPTADRTWTLPDATDTFVGLATSDTLSNKTLASPVITTGDINTPDIDGGTIDAITSLTVANNVDIGSYGLRASALTADGLTAGQVVYTGTDGVLSAESGFEYNASSNTLTATNIAGTLTTVAQSNITSLGTLTALTVDNISINATTIGHTSDTDLLTFADGVLTVAGEVSMTTLDIGGTNVTSTAAELNILDGVTASASELNVMDGVTSTTAEVNYNDTGQSVGTVVASKTVTVDANKDVASFRNITLTGELDAGSLDVSGNADIDGTMEADAYTVDGTTLAEYIADTSGAMFTGNTETGISATYQDADNTVDLALASAQTTITSIYATDLIMGEDAETAIDFGTANEIDFKVDNANRLTMSATTMYHYGTSGTDVSDNPDNQMRFYDQSGVAQNNGAGITLGGQPNSGENWNYVALKAYKANGTADNVEAGLKIYTIDNSTRQLEQRMQINGEGQVAIGDAFDSPDTLLDIRSLDSGVAYHDIITWGVATTAAGSANHPARLGTGSGFTDNDRAYWSLNWKDNGDHDSGGAGAKDEAGWTAVQIALKNSVDDNEADTGILFRAVEDDDTGDLATKMVMLPNGNFGIGDTSPTYKLDVNGTGRFTGTVTVDGDIDLATSGGIYNVGHADNDWTASYLSIKGYQKLVATNNYVQGNISGSDPNIYRIMQQEDSVADNTARDLFKITTIDDQSTMFTAYLDYVVMSDYQETIESGRFLITGGRRFASGNAVVQIEKVYDDTADARGGGESITVSLAGTVSGASDAEQDITFAMTADTQHGNPWNAKWHATIMGGYAAGGASDFITATVV